MDFIDVGPNRIAYRRSGSGPALLLLHGWPFNHTSYDAVTARLETHFTCYRPDTPGLGETKWSESTDFSFGGQARTLRDFADALGLARYAVVAHDTGATIARLLADSDARIDKLVLLNTEIPGHRPPWIPLYRNLAALPGAGRVFPLLLRSRTYLRSPLGFGGCFSDVDHIDAAFVARVVEPLLTSRQRSDGMMRYLRGIDWSVVDGLAATHARLAMPVQLIWGAEDPTFPIALARRMASQFANAQLADVPAARLLVHEEQAEAVAAIALRFLGAASTG
jgi:pimeloyl-ACP methyl ester carboxylesterase